MPACHFPMPPPLVYAVRGKDPHQWLRFAPRDALSCPSPGPGAPSKTCGNNTRWCSDGAVPSRGLGWRFPGLVRLYGLWTPPCIAVALWT